MWVAPEIKEPMLFHHPTRESIGYFGAVRIRDGKFVYKLEEDKFNGKSFWSFLQLLRQKSYRSGARVIVLLDNAKYHHGRLHKDWRDLFDDEFHCEYLPPYSPDLNPIERVWKLTRRLCIHNRYFPTLKNVIGSVENQFVHWEEGNEELRRLCLI